MNNVDAHNRKARERAANRKNMSTLNLKAGLLTDWAGPLATTAATYRTFVFPVFILFKNGMRRWPNRATYVA